MDGLKELLKGMLKGAGVSLTADVSSIVSKGEILTNTSLYMTIFSACKEIGLALLVLYFLIEFMEETTHDNFTIEHFIRLSIKFIIGKELMDNLQTFINSSLAITGSLLESVSGGSTSTFSSLSDKIDTAKMIELFGYLVPVLVAWLLSYVIRGFIFVAAYTRTFEIAIRAMFMPMAVPDIFSGGLNSSGYRYLKKFFATCLQGALIVAVVGLSAEIQNVALSNIGTGAFVDVINFLIIGATTAAVVAKTQQWASDIVN